MSDDDRIIHEREHARKLLSESPELVWGWHSPAGKKRFERRSDMLLSVIDKSDATVLEIGCGTGLLSAKLASHVKKLVSVDISSDLLEVARENCAGCSNIEFKTANAYDLEFLDETFDYVVGCSVLHHLEICEALREFHRVLVSDGRIAFAEPNMLNPQIMLQKNIPFLKRLAGDSPDETAFVRFSLSRMLMKNGFDDAKIVPFDFLHPKTPAIFITCVSRLSLMMESLPVVREIAGSLFISADKTGK